MKDFKYLYGKRDEIEASSKLKKSTAVYAAVAAAYIALCTAFVVLYIAAEWNVYLCFFVNFTATVVFIWYTVLFFSVTFSDMKADIDFYRIAENAQVTPDGGVFLREGGVVKDGRLKFIALVFDTAKGERVFMVRPHICRPFRTERAYDLLLIGNKITAYKEAESD